MANNKKIIRDNFITIKVSKEEKKLWEEYAKELTVPPTRLARNILMMEANNKLSKIIGKQSIKAYKKYLEITNQKEILQMMKED